MRRLNAIAFIVMVSAPLPALAYTQEDADACTPDAMRLCQQAIPDATRITQCLVQNLRQLSPACTRAFYRIRAASARERLATARRTKF
jgi:type II secretory pathway component PulL